MQLLVEDDRWEFCGHVCITLKKKREMHSWYNKILREAAMHDQVVFFNITMMTPTKFEDLLLRLGTVKSLHKEDTKLRKCIQLGTKISKYEHKCITYFVLWLHEWPSHSVFLLLAITSGAVATPSVSDIPLQGQSTPIRQIMGAGK